MDAVGHEEFDVSKEHPLHKKWEECQLGIVASALSCSRGVSNDADSKLEIFSYLLYPGGSIFVAP